MSRYASADTKLASWAARQHGFVSRAQALECGLSLRALQVRSEQGRLLPGPYPGVFLFPGHPRTAEQTLMAAVLAAGASAFASHSSAAALFSMPVPHQSRPEVTVVLERRPRARGIRIHRSGLLVERDVTNIGGIPAATPERIVFDVSSRLPSHALARVIDDALRRHITSLGRLYWMSERLGPAPGRSPKRVHPLLRERLERGVQQESPLEDFVFDAIRKFGLPLPLCQHVVERGGRRYRLDLCYLDPPVALEVDGFAFHGDRSQFDADRLRGNDVSLAGFALLRFTSAFSDWKIAATVAEALGLPIPAKPSEEVHFAAWHRVWSQRAA